MNNLKSIETWCPIFPGFYNTLFEMDNDGVLDNLNEDREDPEREAHKFGDQEITYDNCEWDYKQYQIDVSKKVVSVIEDKLKEMLPAIKEVNFQELRSPREYNFSNDAIDIEVIVSNSLRGQIMKFLKDNHEAWDKYLKERYTSCSGFMSSYENSAEGWIGETKNYTDLDSHYLGSILQFILLEHDDGYDEDVDYTLHSIVMEDIYTDEYCTLLGTDCLNCLIEETMNEHGVCDECIELPEYALFTQKLSKYNALKANPQFPDVNISLIKPVFEPVDDQIITTDT